MRRWSFIPLTLGLTAVAFGAASTAQSRTSTVCGAAASRAALSHVLAAFNGADLPQLDRLIAQRAAFRRYAVMGAPGERAGAAARERSTLIRYFAERHGHSERLELTWFAFARKTRTGASFRFDLVRSADDLAPPTLYRGTAAISCPGRRQLVTWSMAPNTEPSMPAPQTYADTCRLDATWCEFEPSTGAIPDGLRRPLAFPTVAPGSECPVTTTGSNVEATFFGGFARGEGPVQPMMFEAWQPLGPGKILFRVDGSRGWYGAKTLWFSRPEYQGPVLIRGRQLDGPHKVFLGNPSFIDPQLGYGSPLNSRDGWRTWPGATWLRTPGCYAWQIDGTDFSHVIVFEAVFRA